MKKALSIKELKEYFQRIDSEEKVLTESVPVHGFWDSAILCNESFETVIRELGDITLEELNDKINEIMDKGYDARVSE